MSIHTLSQQPSLVAPGFEAVASAFYNNFNAREGLSDKGAAFSVIHRGECVINLFGGFSDAQQKRPWHANTRVNVYSTTKVAVALCVAHLVEQGELHYEDRVAQHWPEFAQQGKEATTVSQLLSHQAGLPAFEQPVQINDLYNWPKVCQLLAEQTPFAMPGTRTCYHPVTFGFLVGELVQRVSGLSLGMYFRKHIALPQEADFYIGLPAGSTQPVADLIPPQSAPELPPGLPDVVVKALTNPMILPDYAATTLWRRAELPAMNGFASAQGIARVYAALSDHPPTGNTLVSKSTRTLLMQVASDRDDLLLGIPAQWAHGLVRNGELRLYGPQPETVGHSGWGGSFGCYDPVNDLAMGYVCNAMGPDLLGDQRTLSLCHAVYESLIAAQESAE